MLVFQESNQQLSFLLIAHEGPIFLNLVFPFRQSNSEFKGMLKFLLAPPKMLSIFPSCFDLVQHTSCRCWNTILDTILWHIQAQFQTMTNSKQPRRFIDLVQIGPFTKLFFPMLCWVLNPCINYAMKFHNYPPIIKQVDSYI
jgi:hypothetical protein